MRIVLTQRERKVAKHLLRSTVANGADATLDLLPEHFHPEAYPALIAYLAGVAASTVQIEPDETVNDQRYQRNQPEVFTVEQRREAHRLYVHQGIRTPEVVAAEREYQRVQARMARERKATAA